MISKVILLLEFCEKLIKVKKKLYLYLKIADFVKNIKSTRQIKQIMFKCNSKIQIFNFNLVISTTSSNYRIEKKTVTRNKCISLKGGQIFGTDISATDSVFGHLYGRYDRKDC